MMEIWPRVHCTLCHDPVNCHLYFLLYSKVKSLGAAESDDDDDSATSWVTKSRKKEKEKVLAEKRVCATPMLHIHVHPHVHPQAELRCYMYHLVHVSLCTVFVRFPVFFFYNKFTDTHLCTQVDITSERAPKWGIMHMCSLSSPPFPYWLTLDAAHAWNPQRGLICRLLCIWKFGEGSQQSVAFLSVLSRTTNPG